VISVGDTTATSVAGTPPMATDAPDAKLDPEIWTDVPPPADPRAGLIAETTGAGAPLGPVGPGLLLPHAAATTTASTPAARLTPVLTPTYYPPISRSKAAQR
jgi:hypothetical protein